jgi:hypothetical protein
LTVRPSPCAGGATTFGLCVLLGVGLSAQSPKLKEKVAPLPKPTGAFTIGTTVAYLTDTTRRDPDLPSGRPSTVQLWYPATGAGPLAGYLV